MKAVRVAMYYHNRDIRLEEMPVPEAGAGELLIRVHAASVCGSDVMEWYRRERAPLVLGHEIAGEVVTVGKGVRGFEPGDRVCATHHVPCGNCHWCRRGHRTACPALQAGAGFEPGGFAEYLLLRSSSVERGAWRLPEGVDYEAAAFVEPLGCVFRAQRRAGLRPGDSVLVLGSGISGLLHIQLAAALGAGLVAATDVHPYRLAAARRFGARAAWPAGEPVAAGFRDLNQGRGADLVIVTAASAPAIEQALAAVGRGGTVLLFAPTREGAVVSLDVNRLFWRRDVTISTSYAAAPEDCGVALELIHRRRVRVAEMISHRFGLAGTGEGFRLVAEGGESLKVIIRPQE